MAYELILSSDTLNIGRIKINSFFNSATGLWSAGTGTQSIVAAASKNTTVGNYGFIAGNKSSGITGNYGSITGGKLNQIRGNFSHISCGYGNYSVLTGDYRFIGNGKQNTTNNHFSTVLNGRKCGVAGKYTTIINGNSNSVQGGTYDLIGNGYKNKIVDYGGAPKYNLIGNGKSNMIDYSVFSSIINGVENNVYYSNFSVVSGKWAAATSSYCFTFGKGTSAVSRLTNPGAEPFTASWGNGTRMIRMRFSAAGGLTSGIFLNGSGTFSNINADYGEYFEWQDQNINSEERTGFFVELSNGKIIIAKSNNVLGIVSKTTAFVGDASDDYWNEMFLKDEWGAPIQRKFYKYKFTNQDSQKLVFFDEKDKPMSRIPENHEDFGDYIEGYDKKDGQFIEELVVNKFNPNYNKDVEYKPRSERKEWTIVGLLGKLRVRTSEQITGQFVDVDTSTGMAKNGTKYHVIAKNKDFDGNYGIVTIFFK